MERSVTTSEFPSGVEQSRNFIVGHVYIAYNYGGRRRRREFQIRRNGISFYLAVTLALSLPLSLSLSLSLFLPAASLEFPCRVAVSIASSVEGQSADGSRDDEIRVPAA
jgi:hypothetical protein